ncbi:MAG: hypothetical protein LUC47_07290, partial [Clostridiales bacterium]|nr:hypothetical protein [Clostridiales bacterium]
KYYLTSFPKKKEAPCTKTGFLALKNPERGRILPRRPNRRRFSVLLGGFPAVLLRFPAFSPLQKGIALCYNRSVTK